MSRPSGIPRFLAVVCAVALAWPGGVPVVVGSRDDDGAVPVVPVGTDAASGRTSLRPAKLDAGGLVHRSLGFAAQAEESDEGDDGTGSPPVSTLPPMESPTPPIPADELSAGRRPTHPGPRPDGPFRLRC